VSQLHVLVRGRVQGVGFRWFVAQRAKALGVAGWVRNTDDGCVEVAARGPEAAVEELRRRVAEGPSTARVEQVEELPPAGIESDTFDVRR
jgi:acylphosphatase